MTFDINEVQLTPSVPEQAITAATLIYDADPALWNSLFSGDAEGAQRYFEEEWKAEESIYGYQFSTSALLRGELVGIEFGLDLAAQRKFSPGTGKRGIPCLRAETAKAFEENCAYIRYLIPSVPDGVYYLQFLSVAAKLRGLGVGAKLLSKALELAKKKGYKACQLDVSGDSPAVAFYLHMGLEILSESRVIPLARLGVHNHYRMVMSF